MTRFSFQRSYDLASDLVFPPYLAARILTRASWRGDLFLRGPPPSYQPLRPSGYTVDVQLDYEEHALTCAVTIHPPPRQGQTTAAYFEDAERRGALEHMYGSNVLWALDEHLRPRAFRRATNAPRNYYWQHDKIEPWQRVAPDDWRDRRFRAHQRVARSLDSGAFLHVAYCITRASLFSDVRGVIEYHR